MDVSPLVDLHWDTISDESFELAHILRAILKTVGPHKLNNRQSQCPFDDSSIEYDTVKSS